MISLNTLNLPKNIRLSKTKSKREIFKNPSVMIKQDKSNNSNTL